MTSHGRPVLKVVSFDASDHVDDVFRDVRGRVRLPPDDELTAPVAADVFADSDLKDLTEKPAVGTDV